MDSFHEKHHYFIGNIFNDEEQVKLLRHVQKKLRKKYKLQECHWNSQFSTNLIYLGYLNTETAYKYMDNILFYLMKAICKKFGNLQCSYTSYNLEYDKSFYKISLRINDENNYLENIIVPYLHQMGIMPIYDKKKNSTKPAIDLIYYKKSNILDNKKDSIRISVPTEKFTINHISLIKGSTLRIRSGTPSVHNQLNLEEIHRYTLPLGNQN
jgi:hypothetical protein